MTRMTLRLLPLLLLAVASTQVSATDVQPTAPSPAKASSSEAPLQDDQPLVWRGDIATARDLMQSLVEAWEDGDNPDLDMEVFNTISGIDAAIEGKVDLAGSARAAFPKRKKEANLNFVPLAWDALAVITNPDNPVVDISLSQLHDIYYGKITNWKELGGPDQTIHLYSVASPLDGIEYSLRKYLFGHGNQPVASRRLYINIEQLEVAVSLDPWGMGVSMFSGAYDNEDLSMLSIDGVLPSIESIRKRTYPLYQALYLVTPKNSPKQGSIDRFVAFATSAENQDIISQLHLLPYDDAGVLASTFSDHQVAILERSAPQYDAPVAAPGASYAAGAAQAPTSERTAMARDRLQAQRERDAASTRAIERNTKATQAEQAG